MIDPSIIASVKKRSNAGFKLLYDKCISYVYSIVKRYLMNESEHQDVIQEVFARVFLSIETYDPKKGAFKFWLRRITVNQCLQHLRQGKSPKYLVPLETISHFESTDNSDLHQITKEEIIAYLQQMPEGYRQIFMLIVIDDYTHKEVAALLNISPETSRSQLSRAKRWLQKKTDKKGQRKLVADGL